MKKKKTKTKTDVILNHEGGVLTGFGGGTVQPREEKTGQRPVGGHLTPGGGTEEEPAEGSRPKQGAHGGPAGGWGAGCQVMGSGVCPGGECLPVVCRWPAQEVRGQTCFWICPWRPGQAGPRGEGGEGTAFGDAGFGGGTEPCAWSVGTVPFVVFGLVSRRREIGSRALQEECDAGHTQSVKFLLAPPKGQGCENGTR